MNLRDDIAREDLESAAKCLGLPPVREWANLNPEERAPYLFKADAILAEVAAVVEKVKNPYAYSPACIAFEEARQAILKAIRGE